MAFQCLESSKIVSYNVTHFLETNLEKQLLHILHTLTLLQSISRATGDVCYMVPALFEKFPYYLAVLAYGILLFLSTTFFEIAVYPSKALRVEPTSVRALGSRLIGRNVHARDMK